MRKCLLCHYQKIRANVELPPINNSDLSTDQKYLYEICEPIREGNVAQQLVSKQPGKMSHARWLTIVNRILRLYGATEESSHELK